MKNKFKFEMPKFSWEKPIEEEILSYCSQMASKFEESSLNHRDNSWFANNRLSEDCALMAKAYRTVENHVRKEIEMRKELNERT